MKKLLQIPLLLVALFLTTIPTSAHDFEVDGIYYRILTDSTVSVSFKGDRRYDYNNEYTGYVTIPSAVFYEGTTYSVTLIGCEAFYDCSGLTSVTIPNSVTSIGYDAFYGCTGLTEVNITDLYAWCKIDFEDWCAYPLYYASARHLKLNGMEITNLVIPNDITEIKNYAFKGCSGLTSVTIPNSVTSIGEYAFSGCSGLTSVTIPNSVTSIGEYAFSGCSGLTEVNYNAENCVSMGSHTYPVFGNCGNLKTINIGENVKSIPGCAFYGCSGLTEVTIPNSVTAIGESAFDNCSGLTEVNITDLSAWCKIDFEENHANPLYYADLLKLNGTEITNLVIPNDITEIKNYAFNGCSGLTSLAIHNSVTSIGRYAFNGCSGLTSVTIPNSVTTIGGYAFSNCRRLTEVAIPNSVTTIGDYAFYGCNELIDGSVVATTQTTATINIISPTQYNVGLYYSDSNKKQAENGVAKLTGLEPNRTIYYYDLALIINGIYCPVKDLSFTTRSFDAILSGSVTASSVTAKGSYTKSDVTILGEGINYGSKVSEYDGKNTIKVNNLDPNSSYTIYYAVNTKEGGVYTVSETFTTSSTLELTTQEAKPTSTTSVRLLAATNCDATEGTGFEWRRYNAPEELPSNKVSCPVVDGVLVGSLRGVVSDVYYKYRPYYTSASGNTYYGEWVAFFTGDANVYFEPDVRTYEDIQVINNSATVRGYALEGTDVITAQGFEYWKTGSTITPLSTENRMTVSASGISMSATLANLEYNSTYKYRAFVTTAKGTVYGDEVEFSTGNDPAGIDYIEIDADEFSVTLRENPATGTAWVKIAGAAGEEVQYTITSMSGALVATGSVILDGEWNAIDLNCPAGMYLLTINDGTQVKTLRLIVK